MRVMFTINSDEASISQAEELKNKINDLLKEYGLKGDIRGEGYSMGASYTGTYGKGDKGKKAKSKPAPVQFDPSQYFKPKEEKKSE